ncbi:hypothetical protein EV175_004972, partial [Coemansia sp. RSA 1933]
NYEVTTLIRKESAAAALNKRGIKTIIGTLTDKPLIQQHVAASDIVIHTANADHLPSVEAVFDGIDQRAKENKHTIYIHTSGTGLLSDNNNNAFEGKIIFSDEEPDTIDALPDNAPHRPVDLTILRRRRALGNKAQVAIIIPPLIYGVSHPANRLSIQLPCLVRYALKHGYAGHIGEGRSVWSQIHVKDLARGYIALLHSLENSNVASADDALPNPYWFCENGHELSWGTCASEIGRVLHQLGCIEDPTPRTIPPDNFGDLYGDHSSMALGSNSRSRADRLRKLGWEAKEKQTLASLAEDEIPIILKEIGL